MKSVTIKQPLGYLEVGQALIDASQNEVITQKRSPIIAAIIPLLNVQTKDRVTHKVKGVCSISLTPIERRFFNKDKEDKMLASYFEFDSVTRQSQEVNA
jgi:hypothetical protein